MTIKTRKLIDISLALGLTASIILSMSGFSASCRDMYENIIRIRIIANSDSDEDQKLKLKVRDAVLEETKPLFEGVRSYDEAALIAANNLEFIRCIAENEIREASFDYSVSLSLRDEYFDTREYDNFTLPAGVYQTLVFTLGEGEGENWWCVLFPQVCVGSCSGRLTDSIEESSARHAEEAPKYRLKFKVVEIFQKFFRFR